MRNETMEKRQQDERRHTVRVWLLDGGKYTHTQREEERHMQGACES